MPIRVYATVGPRNLDEAIAKGPVQSGRLTVRALKIVADGALGSRGAALLADYSDAPGNRGLDVTAPEETERLAEKALRGGFQVWMHAIGDRANRVTLDAYEKALAAVRPVDPRPRIEHAQILALRDARALREARRDRVRAADARDVGHAVGRDARRPGAASRARTRGGRS